MRGPVSVKKNPAGGKGTAQRDELQDAERLSRTVFVGNVPASASRKELKRLFKPYGQVEAVRLRGVIAANPKLPKRTALLARRMHKDCDTILAYVVFKKSLPPVAADQETAESAGSTSPREGSKDVGGEDGAGERAGDQPTLRGAIAPVDWPSEQVLEASRALNLTVLNGKHLRVNPALHTRGPIRQSVFLGNLPFDVTEEELILLFQDTATEAGSNLLGARVTRDRETGMGRGVGYVSFDDELGVRAVMNKAGSFEIRGRVLRLERASKEAKQNRKAEKRKERQESAKKEADTKFGRSRSDRRESRRRDERSGERLTRKIRKERADKKVKTKVKLAARKARQEEAARKSSGRKA